MDTQSINRITWRILILLSLVALCTVLSGFTHAPAPESDEGAAAHIFQLAVLGLVPVGVLFLATADWRNPSRNVRLLAFPAAALLLAFGILYYAEHYRQTARSVLAAAILGNPSLVCGYVVCESRGYKKVSPILLGQLDCIF